MSWIGIKCHQGPIIIVKMDVTGKDSCSSDSFLLCLHHFLVIAALALDGYLSINFTQSAGKGEKPIYNQYLVRLKSSNSSPRCTWAQFFKVIDRYYKHVGELACFFCRFKASPWFSFSLCYLRLTHWPLAADLRLFSCCKMISWLCMVDNLEPLHGVVCVFHQILIRLCSATTLSRFY